ncbi:MAG: fimbrillin family protein [Muribaculaceae bacterium]|nr:fimbrillin family protein [Muribaculaceae bacterium]
MMTFEVSDISRASEAPALNEFSVYGDMKFYGEGDFDPLVVFNKSKVEYVDGFWVYEGAQYWYRNHEHSFVAISPSEAVGDEFSPKYSGSRLSLLISMPAYAGREMEGSQEKNNLSDIVAATHRRLYSKSDMHNSVTFRFGHLFTMINFAPSLDDKNLKDDVELRIHKFEIMGIRNKASLTIEPAVRRENITTDERLVEFADYDGNDSMTITFAESGKAIKNGERKDLFNEDEALILLPQTFESSSDSKVRITYSLSDDPDHMIEGNISLANLKWESGKSYSYNITIDRIGLNVGTATIKNWDTQEINHDWVVE